MSDPREPSGDQATNTPESDASRSDDVVDITSHTHTPNDGDVTRTDPEGVQAQFEPTFTAAEPVESSDDDLPVTHHERADERDEFPTFAEAPVTEPAAPRRDESPSALDDAIGDSRRDDRVSEDARSDFDAPEPWETERQADAAPAADDHDVTVSVAEPVNGATERVTGEEPDYEALAAELEEFERRTSTPASGDDEDTSKADTTVAPLQPPVAEAAPQRPATDDQWYGAAQTSTFSTENEAPTAIAPTATAAQPGPVYVQAPEPPVLRGNRGAAGAIGLVGTLVFAVFFFAASLGWNLLTGSATIPTIVDDLIVVATSLQFWTTVAAFFFAFWLIGVLVNRAGWRSWVLFGFFIALLTYAGHILGALLAAPFWQLTSVESGELILANLLTPLSVLAFVFAREITIWFGGWAARRGAKVTARNDEATAEYQRTIDAGPQLPFA